MNVQIRGLRVASLLFGLFALGHVCRLVTHAQVIVGRHHIPLWVSVVAALIAAALSFWLWRLSVIASR